MAKAPADQFYWNDWERALEEHPLEVAGAWLRICGKLWYSETRGKLEKTVEQWARILRVDIDKASELLNYIKDEEIGDVSDLVTGANKKITVICRRMHRNWKAKENNRIRQQRFKGKRKDNDEVTPLSSSSSSSSSLELKKPGKPAHFEFQVGDLLDDILRECEIIKMLPPKDKILNPYMWVQVKTNESGHPQAILDSLKGVVQYWDTTNDPWGYTNKIMVTKSQNYHEADHIREHEEFKKAFDVDPRIKGLLGGIG